MGKKRDLGKIMAASAAQARYRRSAYERLADREIDPWTRGLHFTWTWQDLGLKWHGYERVFFGRSEWYLEYVPFFWRSYAEFSKFERDFIRKATEPKGTIPERVFVQRARNFKAQLTRGAILGPLVGAVGGTAGGAVGAAATAMDKTNDIIGLRDKWKCMNGDEESCVKVLQGFAVSRFKKAHKR